MPSLPIDYREKPWNEKYLIERTDLLQRWQIHGRFDDGTVDIEDATRVIFTRVPELTAARMVTARNAFCDSILAFFNQCTGETL
jgi:hypothetical protein